MSLLLKEILHCCSKIFKEWVLGCPKRNCHKYWLLSEIQGAVFVTKTINLWELSGVKDLAELSDMAENS